MSEERTENVFLSQYHRYWLLLPLLALAAVIIVLLLFAGSGGGDSGGLKPFRPSPTAGELTVTGQAAVVTFTELNSDPAAFRGQRIRVTGDYLAVPPPDCRPYSGPVFAWSLVAEELQLNARNFESLLRRVPDGTTLTVEGVWRLYDGPLGCGKEAPDGIAWYLAVERIVSPNPLPNFGRVVRPTTAVSTPDSSGNIQPTPLPGTTVAATPTPSSFTPTATPPAALSATPTLSGAATATAEFGSPTPTVGINTPLPSITPLVSSTPTTGASPTPTLAPGEPSPTPTIVVGSTVPPTSTMSPLPTNPAYPGATPVNTPTPTPNPY